MRISLCSTLFLSSILQCLYLCHIYIFIVWLISGSSLVWVFLYGFICFYIQTLIAFAVYRELFDEPTGLHCTNMHECALTIVHRGLQLTPFEVGDLSETFQMLWVGSVRMIDRPGGGWCGI